MINNLLNIIEAEPCNGYHFKEWSNRSNNFKSVGPDIVDLDMACTVPFDDPFAAALRPTLSWVLNFFIFQNYKVFIYLLTTFEHFEVLLVIKIDLGQEHVFKVDAKG